MKGPVLAVVAVCILVLAGTLYYEHSQGPVLPSYRLNVQLENGTSPVDIGNISIAGAHYDIHYNWLNVTLKGYSNYTISFSQNVSYAGIYNSTAHVYLPRNTTATFNLNTTGATGGSINIRGK